MSDKLKFVASLPGKLQLVETSTNFSLSDILPPYIMPLPRGSHRLALFLQPEKQKKAPAV